MFAANLFSQGSGTVTGIVTDPEGNPFVGAFISLQAAASEMRVYAQSEAGGRFKVSPLAPGTYQLFVDVPGMKHYERSGIVIDAERTADLVVRMEDGPSLRTLGEDPATIAKVFIDRAPPPEGPAPKTAAGLPDLSGVWLTGPADLSSAPMLPASQAIMKQRGDSFSKDYPGVHCLPNPIPLASPGFFQLVQSPTALVVIIEGDTPGYRQVFLDGRAHPPDHELSWLGHSVGRWEGDTLVVDTVGFRDQGWLDFEGRPHSSKLRVILRFRRPDLGHLEMEFVIEDPVHYRAAWTVKKGADLAGEELQEFLCTENNQDMEHLQ